MNRSLSRQFAVNVLAQGLARVISLTANLVLLLVVARVMGVQFFGEFSYVLAFSAIVIALADMGTTAVLARGLAFEADDARARYLGNYLMMRLGLLSIAMLAGVLAALLVPNAPTTAMLIMVAGLPALASRFFEPVYQIYGRPWMSLRSNLVFGLMQLCLALWVWLSRSPSLELLVAGLVLSNVVYTAIAAVFMLRLVRPHLRFDRSTFKMVLALTGPVGFSSLFTTVILRADVLMIDHFLGAASVGLYSAAYRILDLAILAAVTIVTPLVPVLTMEIAHDPRQALERCRAITQAALVFTLPVAVVAPYAAEPMLGVALGNTYAPAAAPLVILVWNFVLIVLTLITSSVNLAIGEIRHGYWNTPLAAIINVGLNALLIPSIGIVGAAIAAVSAQISMMTVSHYYTFTRFGCTFAPRTAIGVVVLALALALLLALIEPWLGWGLAVPLGLGAYLAAALRLRLVPLDSLLAIIEARRRSRERVAAGHD